MGFRRITDSVFAKVLAPKELTGTGQNKNKALDSGNGEPTRLIRTKVNKLLVI